MIGTYTGYLQTHPRLGFAGPKVIPAQIVAIQKSLDRDGIAYVVEADDIKVTIRASGTPKRRKRSVPTPRVATIEAPTLEQLTKRLKAATDALASNRSRLRGNLQRQYRTDDGVDRDWMVRRSEERVQHRRVGAAVAKVMARHHVGKIRPTRLLAEDYAVLDAACGCKVARESQVSEARKARAGGYLGCIVQAHTGSYRFSRTKADEINCSDDSGPNTVQSFLGIKSEVEYLAELVRLARERGKG